MANWCVGTLKIRGSFEQVCELLINETCIPPHGLGKMAKEEVPPEKIVEKDENSLSIELESNGWVIYQYDGFGLLGSIGMYIDPVDIEIRDDGIYCLELESKWEIDTNWIAKMCKKYQVDMKLFAFEKGQEFNRDIECLKGDLITDNVITYDNYFWECPYPELGG